MKNLILASSSPRRKEILKNVGYDFEIISSNYDEKISGKTYSKELVENCAYNKALEVFKNNINSTIISADTVVVLDNIILGKPKDEKEAFLMLQNLSSKTHFVATSICIMNKENTICATEKTYVHFRDLSDSEILNYIKDKKPLDKAGSYGIQDENFDFHTSINGQMDNIIGFPMELFKNLIKNL